MEKGHKNDDAKTPEELEYAVSCSERNPSYARFSTNVEWGSVKKSSSALKDAVLAVQHVAYFSFSGLWGFCILSEGPDLLADAVKGTSEALDRISKDAMTEAKEAERSDSAPWNSLARVPILDGPFGESPRYYKTPEGDRRSRTKLESGKDYVLNLDPHRPLSATIFTWNLPFDKDGDTTKSFEQAVMQLSGVRSMNLLENGRGFEIEMSKRSNPKDVVREVVLTLELHAEALQASENKSERRKLVYSVNRHQVNDLLYVDANVLFNEDCVATHGLFSELRGVEGVIRCSVCGGGFSRRICIAKRDDLDDDDGLVSEAVRILERHAESLFESEEKIQALSWED